ncbi:hypothetical protein NHQ30_009911, partial [Ciborinia camelliae]
TLNVGIESLMHLHIFGHRLCLQWVKAERIGKTDSLTVCCRSFKHQGEERRRKKFAFFGVPRGVPHSFRSSSKNSEEIESTIRNRRQRVLKWLHKDSGMDSTESSSYFRDSVMNGNRKESIQSPQSPFSFQDWYTPSSISISSELPGDYMRSELSGDSIFHELPNSSVNYSCFNGWDRPSPTLDDIVSQSSTFQGFPAILDISEADSASIKELACQYGGPIGPEMSCNTEMQDQIFNTGGHRSCHNSDFNTSMAFKVFGTMDNRQNPMGQNPMGQMYPSSGLSPSRSPKLRHSVCPPIQTDLHQYGYIQPQEGLSAKSPEISPPDTCTTNTSCSSISIDSSRNPAALESRHNSISSPESSYSLSEQPDFDPPFYCEDAQIPGHSAAHHEIGFQFQMQYLQASCFLDHQRSPSESKHAEGADYSCFEARSVDVIG